MAQTGVVADGRLDRLDLPGRADVLGAGGRDRRRGRGDGEERAAQGREAPARGWWRTWSWRWRCSPMRTTRRSRPGWRGRSRTGTAGRSPGTARRPRAGSRRPGSGSALSPCRSCSRRSRARSRTMDTPGAFLGRWRLMSIDGMEWDVPDTPANAAFFGYPGTGKDGDAGRVPQGQGGHGRRVRARTRRCWPRSARRLRRRAAASSPWPGGSTRGWRRTGC